MAKNSKKAVRVIPKTRKQLRKEKRLQKKVKRNEFYLNKNKVNKLELNCVDDKLPKNIVNAKKVLNDTCSSSNLTTVEKQLKQNQKESRDFKKLQKEMKEERKRQLIEANEKEDRVIKTLEKKLKLDRRKTKSLPKSFVNDGFDYLLEVCDYEKYKDSINLEKELKENVVDFDDDLAVATGMDSPNSAIMGSNSDDDPEKSDDDDMSNATDLDCDIDYDSDGSEESENFPGSKEEKTKIQNTDMSKNKFNKKPNESVVSGYNNDAKKVDSEKKQDFSARMRNLEAFVSEENGNHTDSSNDERVDDNSCEESDDKKFQEDIYGRLRDKDGNIVEDNQSKYIPPHLRASLQTSSNENSEVLRRLRKLMKGALNRLTESNMHSITTQMEDIYVKYSRNDSNSVLLELLKESIVTPVLSPERIIIEHALLISLLHANVGSEIGAFILQNLVEEFQKMFDGDICIEDKRIDNVVVFLCQLYNFKIFHSCLIYEILKKFVEKFCEKEVELILHVLKYVGFSLRKDDPASLKELIYNIQKKSNESTALRESARVRFMLDTLSAVKNNNMLKMKNYDPTYVEHMKKIQKSFLRPGKYVTELKISLEDLLNVDTKGRWWIVGSAWTGSINNAQNKEAVTESSISTFDQNVVNLAKKHRMNTDIRRNIFCILMTAEDYIDAFEKLVKLGLRGQQCQEIIYVLMHCLLKEKKYNPYYAFIAEQFCSSDRKCQLAIQFSTWDKFKEINSFTNQQIVNLAKFLTYLFMELKLPLSILKVLHFTEMNKPMVKLIRQIVLTILLSEDETVVVEVFSRIAKSEKLFMLREGLQLFLHHFVIKNIEKNVGGDESKHEMLSKRVELAVNTMRGSSTDF